MWIVCNVMAENDEKDAADDESFACAYGTLAGLNLLRPFIDQVGHRGKNIAFKQSKQYLQKINALTGQHFPNKSTTRQLLIGALKCLIQETWQN